MTPMFEFLRDRYPILVSGPGRSGTRICAKMIAHDTGLDYIDEVMVPGLFVIGEEVRAITNLLLNKRNVILHCPTLCRYLHELPIDAFVVFMVRDVEEIQRSQQRVHVKKKSLEREYNKYGYSRFFKSGLPKTAEDISVLKHKFWQQRQKPEMQEDEYMEVQYYDLRSHPLWLEKEQRRNFKWNQTN